MPIVPNVNMVHFFLVREIILFSRAVYGVSNTRRMSPMADIRAIKVY